MTASAVLSRKCLRTKRQLSAWKNTRSASVALRSPCARDSSRPRVRSAKRASRWPGDSCDAASKACRDILVCIDCPNLDSISRQPRDQTHVQIMDFATVALFEDLLPSAGEQLPQISMHCWITHRVFHGTASGWQPSTGDRARGIHVCVYMERHCHPWLQEFTSLLVKCLRFSEASRPYADIEQPYPGEI